VWLLFVGTGELRDKAVTFVRQNDIKHVIFLGRVSNEDLPIAYASADYYVMSSVYEGQPLTVLEAMASGLPCIVSDIPSIDVVRKAECGLLVDYQSAPSCADTILEYLKKDNRGDAVNGREYVVRYLDWEIIARKYLERAKGGSTDDPVGP
jgi:glycosyltransferase involved in cell wall biosynthesis